MTFNNNTLFKEAINDAMVDDSLPFIEIESDFESSKSPYVIPSEALKALVNNLEKYDGQEVEDEMYPPSLITEAIEKSTNYKFELEFFHPSTIPPQHIPILIYYMKDTNSAFDKKDYLVEGYYKDKIWYNYTSNIIKTENSSKNRNIILGWSFVNNLH